MQGAKACSSGAGETLGSAGPFAAVKEPGKAPCQEAAQAPQARRSTNKATNLFMSNEMKVLVAGLSVASQTRTSKAGSFFQLPQVCLPASLEAEMLCLRVIIISVPNHNIVLYSHDAITKQNCSVGISIGRHSVRVCLQPRAALWLGTAPSLALQPSHCTSWQVWLSLPFRLDGKLNCMVLIISPLFEGRILRDLTTSNYGNEQPEKQLFLYRGLSAMFKSGKLAFLWWSFLLGSVLVDLTLFSSFSLFWMQWSLCIALVTSRSSQWDGICCVVSGNMFNWYLKLK